MWNKNLSLLTKDKLNKLAERFNFRFIKKVQKVKKSKDLKFGNYVE